MGLATLQVQARLRVAPRPSLDGSNLEGTGLLEEDPPPSEDSSSSSSSSSSSATMTGKTLSGLGKLIKLLPTGTVFLFHFLSPVLTNNGDCKNNINKYLSIALLGVCGLSCFFSTFTDSYEDSDGTTHYGIATLKGLWPSSGTSSVNLSSHYKLKFADFVHAFFSLLVFATVALLDNNITECFYPSFNSAVLLQGLPPVIGTISGAVFVYFPYTRHGIGYPSSSSSYSSISTPLLGNI
ncbi:hypothetical protein RHMOL_Rhmol02G0017100 [Rhododendron molle]|uniref:Uncharacterized protein n=1 Tax=Rhododendron molle TaxID=49168 RepID=A0ACC0PM96_RHOML|nr:hypothetical protein RHMOL_Rhmol02G0017100 [Rhododendron molle]